MYVVPYILTTSWYVNHGGHAYFLLPLLLWGALTNAGAVGSSWGDALNFLCSCMCVLRAGVTALDWI